MNVTFDFDPQKVFAQSISVDDIGNCALRCTNKDFEDYYIIIQTTMGKSFILKFGPIIADVDALTENFDLSYKKIDYKEQSISLEIKKLLLDTKKQINQVEQLDIVTALNAIPTQDKFVPVE